MTKDELKSLLIKNGFKEILKSSDTVNYFDYSFDDDTVIRVIVYHSNVVVKLGTKDVGYGNVDRFPITSSARKEFYSCEKAAEYLEIA